ncbi:hypothetical protein SHAM105786_10730 [Shewanella amazonensis]|nr:hypothetical protein [Shewanella amazonensis]
MSNKKPVNNPLSDKSKKPVNSHQIRKKIEDILIAREQQKKLEL